MMMMYLFTTVPHPHGHWQLQELLGNDRYRYSHIYALEIIWWKNTMYYKYAIQENVFCFHTINRGGTESGTHLLLCTLFYQILTSFRIGNDFYFTPAMVWHLERPYLGRKVFADFLLLCVKTHPLPNHLSALVTPHIERHLKTASHHGEWESFKSYTRHVHHICMGCRTHCTGRK